jgi:hypothetical protein
MDSAEEPFETGGKKFNRGSLVIKNVAAADLQKAASELGLQVQAVSDAPSVKTHPVRAARVAIMHTWLSTQDEGWWRIAFDQYGVPFDYISTQDATNDSNLRAKYDVIVMAPVGGNPQAIVQGMPMWGNPLPWKVTALTPNLAKTDETDDMRPGLGWSGVMNLQKFIRDGGVFIGCMDTAELVVTTGITAGVTSARGQRLRAPGTVVKSKLVDATSPIAYGYNDGLSIFYAEGPIFGVSNFAGGRGGGRRGGGDSANRETGRGTPADPDTPQGRSPADAVEEPTNEVWQATPVTDEQRRNGVYLIPPAMRPRVVLRYSDVRDLFVSGLLDGGSEIAQRPAVIDVPVGSGHAVLFSNNPFWRGETQGSYFFVFNAIMNFDNLNAGRKLDEK